MADNKTGYEKNVKNLGFVSMFTDISSEMIFGILPIFLIDELGLGKGIFGFIEGVGESVGYGSRTFSGALSDKIGKRKPLVFLGYFLSTVAKPLFAISSVWQHVLSVRVTDRLGKGIRNSPRDALLSDSVKSSSVGRAFGLHRSLDSVGAVVGPLIAFFFIPVLDIRDIFWISLIPAAIALVIIIFFVKEKRIVPRDTSVLSNFKQVLNGKFLLFMIIFTIFSLGAFNFSFILLEGMDAGLAPALIPVIYVVINIAHAISGYPAGILSDRVGPQQILLVGFILFFIVSVMGFSDANTVLMTLGMAAIFGTYIGISITSQKTIVSKIASEKLKGTAFGIYYLFIGVSFLIANTLFGVLLENFGTQYAYGYSMILCVSAIVILVISQKFVKLESNTQTNT